MPKTAATPDWTPLAHAIEVAGPTPGQSTLCLTNRISLPPEAINDFMWMCENPAGVHQYKHRDTRNYAMLTGNETREEAFTALSHAYDCSQKWKDQPKRTAQPKEPTCPTT